MHTLEKIQNTKLQKQSPAVFCKNGAITNFAKYTSEHLCQSLKRDITGVFL